VSRTAGGSESSAPIVIISSGDDDRVGRDGVVVGR
jgi:hypothetical protein